MRKKVKTKWGVNISGDGDILVKVGDQVSEGQIWQELRIKKWNRLIFPKFSTKLVEVS
jgi:hypothetical protein